MLKKEFSHYETFIFDLDGTLLLQNKIFPESVIVLNTLTENGKDVLFISNNTTEPAEHYISLFLKNGIKLKRSQFTFSTDVLLKHFYASKFEYFFLIGEKNLSAEFSKIGKTFTEDFKKVERVIVTLDRNYNKQKFEIAKKCLINGAELYAANIDKSCPIEKGEIIDAGEIINQLCEQTGKTLLSHYGKPSDEFFRHLKKKIKSRPSDCIIIGDRLETDIALACSNGIDAALVATGIKNEIKSQKIRPKFLLKSIADLFEKE